jgi:DNA-binding transcriptional MocR family regulator
MSRGGEPGCRLDRATFVPLPQQLYPRLRDLVLSGRVGESATLGTERELKETFGVSCATVRVRPRRLTYGERPVPVEYVEGVHQPARYKYLHHLPRQRLQAGEPIASRPRSAAPSLTPADSDEVTGGGHE